VNVGGWRLKGGVDFTFVSDTVVRPGDYVLVVNFNPTTDLVSLNAFRAALSVPESVRIYGPFQPKLGNDSVSVELAYPGPAVAGVTPFINMDRVEYTDYAPWPVSADGSGASIQRLSRSLIGNDAINWSGATPTPGAVNVGQVAITDNDADGLPNTWEDAYNLDKFNAADAALDADSDGQSNGSEFVAGTDPRNNIDRLTASVAKVSGGPGFVISFPAKAGRQYFIEYKSELSDATWQPLVTIPSQTAPTTIQYTDPTATAQRFYHVKTNGQ
jgi:hypothetical protein